MIFGIGTDIVETERIEKIITRNGERFIERNFSDKEIIIANTLKNKTSYFAKRFAAKEAFAKAMGTGIGEHAAFKDISTLNNRFGAPYISLTGRAKDFVDGLRSENKGKKINIKVSLSDEKHYAQAFVIIELID